jgi:hypothetical protein
VHDIQRGRVHYYVLCVHEFARRKNLTIKDAFTYLDTHQGLQFLIDCYDAEHTLSLNDAVEDLTILCAKNGGGLG